MRVLHTLDSLNRGGTETLALDVCRNAGTQGIDLTFVATGGGELETQFEQSGARYIRLHRRLPFDPNLVANLRRIVKENEIQIVHGHQPVEAMHLYFATAGLSGVKRVLSHHGGGLFLAQSKNRFASRLFTPLMDANISCSNGLLPWLRAKVGLNTNSKFSVVYNGVDPERLRADGRPLRDELGLGTKTVLLGMVANFVGPDTKDQITVCKALGTVCKAFEDFHFVFAGGLTEDGEEYYRSCVDVCRENGIEDRVTFLGSRNDIPNVLHSLDLFVFSTLHEGLPIALCEAMLAGVPVVASDIEPNIEATGGGEFAVTFEAGNPDQLAESIIELLSDTARRNTLSESARIYANENFSIKAHLSSLVKLYSDLLE